MLSKELEVALNDLFKNANEKRHEFVTVEHLLLALIDNTPVREVMIAVGVNVNHLQDKLTQFIDETITIIPAGVKRETQPTMGFQRVLQRAVFHVQASDKKEVTAVNVFVAIFSEQDSHAVYLLTKQDVSRFDVVNYTVHGVNKKDYEFEEAEDSFSEAYDENFDYKTLLRLKDEEIERIKSEKDGELEKHKQLIVLLEKEINGLKESNTVNKIIRSIEFKPEHRQAGFSILNYFSEIVIQKYPDKKNKCFN